MTITGFFLLLVIAAVAGAVGQSLAGYSIGGCIGSIVLGFIGAYVGTWLAAQFHLPSFFAIQIDGRTFPLIWAIVGSALLATLASWVTSRRRLV